MAGLRTRRNPLFGSKNELARALTNGNSTSAIFYAPISTPTQALAPTFASAAVSISGLSSRYTDKDLQRATKLTLKLFVKGQEHGQLQASSALRNCPLKAQNPDFYYRSLHMEYYYFCQQYEDHFDTAKAIGHKRVLFSTLFLRNRINFSGSNIKRKLKATMLSPLLEINSRSSSSKVLEN